MLSVGVTLPGVSVAVGTPTQQAAPSTPSTPSTPSAPSSTTKLVPPTTTKSTWAMRVDETIYLNLRLSTGPGAWVSYRVVHLFADGNAVLVREPDCVAYTGSMAIGENLRREGESYDS